MFFLKKLFKMGCGGSIQEISENKTEMPDNDEKRINNEIKFNLLLNLPEIKNKILSDKQIEFFRTYGFIVLKGLIATEKIEKARKAAEVLIQEEFIKQQNNPSSTSGDFPESSRPSWADCKDPDIQALFTEEKNLAILRSLVGPFDFEKHKSNGAYSFAPRFKGNLVDPPGCKNGQKVPDWLKFVNLEEPYDLKSLPNEFTSWSKKMFSAANELSIGFSPCRHGNWQIDGWDIPSIAWFSLIWRCSLTSEPKGNMGNLIVYPGSHYVIGEILKNSGARNTFWYNKNNGERQRPLPTLECPGKADGRPYYLILEPGDIFCGHPFLAIGNGLNITEDTRLRVNCRLLSDNHSICRQSIMFVNGDEMNPGTWVGNLLNLIPGLK